MVVEEVLHVLQVQEGQFVFQVDRDQLGLQLFPVLLLVLTGDLHEFLLPDLGVSTPLERHLLGLDLLGDFIQNDEKPLGESIYFF